MFDSEPRIVVAYGSGVLAGAVKRRLADCAEVELVPARDTPRRLGRRKVCDAVVVDPFLTELEHRWVRDAVASVPHPPVLVLIRNAEGHVAADVDDFGDPGRAAMLEPVVAALTR